MDSNFLTDEQMHERDAALTAEASALFSVKIGDRVSLFTDEAPGKVTRVGVVIANGANAGANITIDYGKGQGQVSGFFAAHEIYHVK